MNYSGGPGKRDLSNEEYIQQRLNKISLESEVRDERLHGRRDGGNYSDSNEIYDSRMDPIESDWDCSITQAERNLDAVVTDLTPEEVRWFYKSEGEKRWLEFSGYDSLHIEIKFRETFYSKFSAFPDQSSKPPGSHYFSGMSSYFGTSSIRFPPKQGNQYSQPSQNRFGEPQHSQQKIIVRGGLYDINFDTWKCSSIYWPGEECQITRGTWFYEGAWQPLDQEHSRALESKHLSMFQGRKLSEFVENETKGTIIHAENFPDFTVEWISPTLIYLYGENVPSKAVRTVTTKTGFRKSAGCRLFRGYKNEASLNDRPDVEINHLVFVIHGVGQKMDTGRIIRNTSSFRDCVSWLKQKYFSNFPNHRAEFFPVEWRSNLQLDGDLVEAVTPNTLQSLRQMLNASAMDIMYYTSPLYGGEVQRGLREELNRLYSMFSARNPYFVNKSGKISVIAHSLGCVILYDIIMGLKPGSSIQNNQQGLLFQVQNFFCLGSPLSVFLALRWKNSQTPGKLGVVLPQRLCHRLFNVFHPTDPAAYRIEPLLVKDYARVAPLVIQPYNATYRTPYSEMPIEIIAPEQQSSAEAGATNQTVANKEDCSPGGTPKDKSWSIWGLRNNGARKSNDGTLEPLQEGLEYRLDYVLRESSLGVSYLSALSSHTAYWTNYDIAYFVLTQLFPEFENGDSSSYPAKNYSDNYNSYSENYPQESQYDYENRNHGPIQNSNFRGSDRGNFPGQNVDFSRQSMQPSPAKGVVYNSPSRFQSPNYQNVPDHRQQQDPASFASQSCSLPEQNNYPPQYPPESQNQYQQPGYGPQYSPGQQPQSSSHPQNYPAPNQHQHHQQYQQEQQYQQQEQQYQQQQQLQQQIPQPPLNYPRNIQSQEAFSNYSQQQNYSREQAPFQSYQPQQQPQNAQAMQAGPAKSIPTKTGFFDRIADEKKLQGAVASPTKSTKSFFPSFNLSSLTSPVKNLSNSLSNISNQMTNIGGVKDNGGNIQTRSPAGFLGNVSSQSKNASPNYPRPTRSQSPQVHYNQGQYGPGLQVGPGPNQQSSQNLQQLGVRSNSSYEMHSAGIRSGSPVSLQNRCSPMQYGPIETPVGAIKPKTIRLQPKVPSYEQKIQFGHDPASSASKTRSVSPLGQSRVVCSSRPRTSSPGGCGGPPLGGRSLSSGNLRNSVLVAGTYPGSRANYGYLNQPGHVPPPGLDRKTMSRPNLTAIGNSYAGSGLGSSSLVYNTSYGSSRTYLNREYSGPSSR